MIVEIPLLSVAQTLVVVLRGISYQLTISRNTRMAIWTMNIEQDGQSIADGIALVGGVDVVEQYPFELKDLWAINPTDSALDAGSDNLGTEVLLVQVDDEDVESIGNGAGVISSILT